MKLEIMFNNGCTSSLSVRYHDGEDAGLWASEESVLRYIEDRKGFYSKWMTPKRFANTISCASAPFKIFKGDWNDCNYIDESKLIKSIPFADLNWNYM